MNPRRTNPVHKFKGRTA